MLLPKRLIYSQVQSLMPVVMDDKLLKLVEGPAGIEPSIFRVKVGVIFHYKTVP